MARVVVIMNPVAARTDPNVVRTVSSVLTREGWDVEVVGTTRPGHAAELARAALDDGITRIAIYGGDGTTMQAVSGVVGEEVEFGLVRGGTGNLLAGNLRLPRDPAKAALVIARGVPRRIDLGRIVRSDGDRYFAVACGAGYDAELMARTTSAAKRRWKFAAYVAQVLQTLAGVRNASYRITVDGELLEVEAATVMVANCAELIPPFIRFGTGISVDDGLLDVVILRAQGIVQSAGVVWRLWRGGNDARGNVRYARGRVVTVETDPVQPVQLDGEAAGETPFTAEILPGSLRILVPSIS